MPTAQQTPRFSAPHPRRSAPPDIPNTPETRAHAAEAEQLAEELRVFGVDPKCVAPTRDCAGHVRLNFAQVRQLLGI
jgi:hypothetical protein